jgi:hypothetical protein
MTTVAGAVFARARECNGRTDLPQQLTEHCIAMFVKKRMSWSLPCLKFGIINLSKVSKVLQKY